MDAAFLARARNAEGPDAKKECYSVRHRANNGRAVYATPMAGPKLERKCLKLVSVASKAKKIRRGIKEVAKALRKNEGKDGAILVLASDVTPIDVMTHLPIVATEKDVPWIFVPTKEGLGAASNTKRPTSCVLVLNEEAHSSKFNKLKKQIDAAHTKGDESDEESS